MLDIICDELKKPDVIQWMECTTVKTSWKFQTRNLDLFTANSEHMMKIAGE